MVYYVLFVLASIRSPLAGTLAQCRDKGAQILPRLFPPALHADPVAVSWMIGKSLMEYRFGPAATLARHLGWTIRLLHDALDRAPQHRPHGCWVWIPFIMILLLAGLQAMPKK